LIDAAQRSETFFKTCLFEAFFKLALFKKTSNQTKTTTGADLGVVLDTDVDRSAIVDSLVRGVGGVMGRVLRG
jgi:phosphomannomutase